MAEVRELPPEVIELLAYLKQTGTGKSKLQALKDIALSCNNAEQFVTKAAAAVPELTWQKAQKFLEEKGLLAPVASKPVPAAPVNVETTPEQAAEESEEEPADPEAATELATAADEPAAEPEQPKQAKQHKHRR